MKILPMTWSNNKTTRQAFGTTLLDRVNVGSRMENDLVDWVFRCSKKSVPSDIRGPYSFIEPKTGFVIDVITKDTVVPNIIYVSNPRETRAAYEFYSDGMDKKTKRLFHKAIRNFCKLVEGPKIKEKK